MTLDQLRIFLEVAERGHVTRAAEALGMESIGRVGGRRRIGSCLSDQAVRPRRPWDTANGDWPEIFA